MAKKLKTTGIVKRHPDGFGFFIPNDPQLPDALIPNRLLRNVMTHDQVYAILERGRQADRWFVIDLQIIQRHWKRIVGPLKKHGSEWIIPDAEHSWGQDLKITKFPPNATVKENIIAVVDITQYPSDNGDFEGEVIQILGPIEEAQWDIARVAHQLHIPIEFTPKARQLAAQIHKRLNDPSVKDRKDLRHLPFVTIDGATAKDFDDAIFVQKNTKGYKIIVAIADVTHFVQPGSALDHDAYERGTSVYFPGSVIPMLPEELSNDLCSLLPHKDRLVFACEIDLNPKGQITRYRFYEAIIHSHARLTYGIVQELLNAPDVKTPDQLSNYILTESLTPYGLTLADLVKLQPMLRIAKEIAEVTLHSRLENGSLDLEIPEVQINVDALGNPLEIIPMQRLFSHRIIEELMLLANKCAADFFQKHQVHGLYRIHEPPKPDAIQQLALYARAAGFKFNAKANPLQKEIRRLLESIPEEKQELFSMLVLRSLKQARYSVENVGHFALNFSKYTHFTSPIRRYPDIIVHRIIKSVLYPKRYQFHPSFEDIDLWANWLSACEQRAVRAERQIQAIKKARYMENLVGQSFVGIISGVTRFGIFVTLKHYAVDGLVHLENLNPKGKSTFEYNEELMTLTDKKNHRVFRLGDPVLVRLDSVDFKEGKIDFYLIAHGKDIAKISKTSDQPSVSMIENKFDPGQKLMEIFKKKGIIPSKEFLANEGIIPQFRVKSDALQSSKRSNRKKYKNKKLKRRS